ncbi:hypothetical protein RPE78_04880 [Thioclava litoralis]|uniref:Uncharacterized protein n=1 Tax=Thioclava litoralis TaxID=3076557 RepID=A0ABZ1E2E7_9RHOB|nr:hypothetical protein RPE78_04880 [Thioclava sp. FTW29]
MMLSSACPTSVGNRLRESKTARASVTLLERHDWLARLPEGAEVRGIARKEAYRIVRPADAV